MRRAAREGIGMNQIVTFLPRQPAIPFFDRPEARVIHLPGARVRRQKLRNKPDRPGGVGPQGVLHRFPRFWRNLA